MSRHLPIYFLIDTSRSMMGAKIKAVNEGLTTLVQVLRRNPYALELSYLSIITFSTEATQVLPKTDLLDVQLPVIKAVGWTNIEAGLNKLLECMDNEVVSASIQLEQKGDYKPIVVIFSDGGQSQGDYHNILEKVHARFKKCQAVTAFVATGGQYRSYFDQMKEIVGPTGQAIALADFDSASFEKVINIVSQSVSRAQ